MIDIPQALEERYGKRHLSYSSLKVALTDMAKFDQYMKGELKFKSDALDFGTLYDMLLFERDKAMNTYQVISQDKIMERLSDKAKASKRPQMTNEYKAVVAALETEAIEEGKIICSPDDWKQANDMIERLHVCGLYNKTLADGSYQVEFNDVIGGVEVKGFLDCLMDGFIVDSKSTKDVAKFRYSVRDFSYDIQAYIYTKVFGIDKFYWLAQEKTYPYLPALVECSEETLFTGGMKFDEAVRRITRFLSDDSDPMTDYVEFKV
jgi:hypothetical protein